MSSAKTCKNRIYDKMRKNVVNLKQKQAGSVVFVCAQPAHPHFRLKRLPNEEGNKTRQHRKKAADLKITPVTFEKKVKTFKYEMKSLNMFETRPYITQLDKTKGPLIPMIFFTQLQKNK